MRTILRIMLRSSHRSVAWLSHNTLSRLLVIDLQAGKKKIPGDEVPTRSVQEHQKTLPNVDAVSKA